MARIRLTALVPLVLAGLLPLVIGQQAMSARAETARAVQSIPEGSPINLQATATRFVTVQIITSTLGMNASSATPTMSSVATSSIAAHIAAASSAVQSGSPLLETKIGPAFGILGALLIISGLALAITRSAHRRLAVFIVTIYSWALITFVLILHFGVEQQVSSPSQGIRVAFLVASLAAGLIFGAASLIFHRGAKVIIAPVAGFLLGVVLQSLRDDGLIRPIGLRYFLYLGLTGLAFVIGIVPRCIDTAILVSTAFLGALAFVIGLDCFIAANLKEFFVYNLGFSAIFPRLDGHFPISPIMQIELGVILLVFAISLAAQIRLYNLFENKLSVLLKRSDQEKNTREEEKAARRIEEAMKGDVEKFDHRYSRGFPFSVPSERNSPQFSLPSMSTPKSESAPLLPELAYASSGLASEKSMRKSILAQVGTLTGVHKKDAELVSPLASPVLAAPEMEKKDSAELAQEIVDQEKALQEIALLRQKIGRERDSLRPGSSGSEASSAAGASVPFPAAAYRPPSIPLPRSPVQPTSTPSQSYNDLAAPQHERASTFAAPRPISQHSQIITPVASSSARLALQHTTSSPVLPAQTQRISASVTNGNLAHHQRARSSGAFAATPMMARSPSSGTLPGTQRIITGTLASRPSSQTISRGQAGMVRTQSMDIKELQARHTRRLSQLQGGAGTRTSVTSLKAVVIDASPAARDTENSRKRSSTLAGIGQRDRPRAEKRQSRIDEFGRPVAPVKTSQSTQAIPAVAAPPVTASAPVKKSASDWLSY